MSSYLTVGSVHTFLFQFSRSNFTFLFFNLIIVFLFYF